MKPQLISNPQRVSHIRVDKRAVNHRAFGCGTALRAVCLCLLLVQGLVAQVSIEQVGQWPGYHRGNCVGVAVSGDHAYVAAGTGLEIHNVQDPANPVLVGRLPTTGSAWGVAMAGNYACVVGNRRDPSAGRMEMIDVTDPSRPQLAGAIEFTGYGASSIAISGNLAFVAAGSAGLLVMDISSPTHPQQLGAFVPGYSVGHVALSDGHAYLTGEKGLDVIDISIPSNPRPVGTWHSGYSQYGVAVSGHYAFTGSEFDGLQVVDVSRPESPQWAGGYPIAGYAIDVTVADGIAYVAGDEGLHVLDVSNPAIPQPLGGWGAPYAEVTTGGANVTVSGTYAFIADEWRGLQVIDVSTPNNPVRVGGYNIHGEALDVAFSGDHAFVADRWTGFKVIDVSVPSTPRLVGQCDVGGSAVAVAISGGFAYVGGHALPGGWYGLMWVVDITDIKDPRVVAEWTPAGKVNGIAASGNFIFVLSEVAQREVAILETYDITDPTNPEWIATFESSTGRPSIRASGFTLSDGHAYLATEGGLQVLDISDPSNLRRIGGYSVDLGQVSAVAVSGNYAILAPGFLVLNISTPAQPRLVYQDPKFQKYNGFAFFGDYLLATRSWEWPLPMGNMTLEVIDLSNPSSPKVIASYDTKAQGYVSNTGLTVIGQEAYFLKRAWGLEIVQLVMPPEDVGLSALYAAGSLTLTWPSTATGFGLESSLSPTATTWNPVAGTPQLMGEEYQLIVPLDDPARFFRLWKP